MLSRQKNMWDYWESEVLLATSAHPVASHTRECAGWVFLLPVQTSNEAYGPFRG